MKTDIELQKLLAEELPKLIGIINAVNRPKFIWVQIQEYTQGRARIWGDPVTDREWLWIVAECEKKLTPDQQVDFVLYLHQSGNGPMWVSQSWQCRAVAVLRSLNKI